MALKILPSPIKDLIQNSFYRTLHCRFGVPRGMYEYVIARTKYMDAVYERAVAEKFDQIIILGAGFDSRAIRFPSAGDSPKVYEFDSKTTQQAKFAFYEKNGVPLPLTVQFEAIDFVQESLSQRMETIGFPRNRHRLFLMEGVSMYLEPGAMQETFKTISEYMGQSSLVAFDYVYADVLRREKRHYGETAIVNSVSRVKESWRFGIEKHKIEPFLAAYGLRLVNHMTAKDMEEKYFKDEQGRIIASVNDTHCLVTGEKK